MNDGFVSTAYVIINHPVNEKGLHSVMKVYMGSLLKVCH